MFATCIRHRHASLSPIVLAWGTTGYTTRSPLVHYDGTLNNHRYIFVVLRPVALPFLSALRNATFQQDNALRHVAGIVRTFLDTENFLAAVQAYTFYKSLTNWNCLANNRWATGSSLLISHYCRWTVVHWWSCMDSCICIFHPMFVRLFTRLYTKCYYFRMWLF